MSKVGLCCCMVCRPDLFKLGYSVINALESLWSSSKIHCTKKQVTDVVFGGMYRNKRIWYFWNAIEQSIDTDIPNVSFTDVHFVAPNNTLIFTTHINKDQKLAELYKMVIMREIEHTCLTYKGTLQEWLSLNSRTAAHIVVEAEQV